MKGNGHCIRTRNDRGYSEGFIDQNLKLQSYVHFEWLKAYLNGSIVEFNLIILFRRSH